MHPCAVGYDSHSAHPNRPAQIRERRPINAVGSPQGFKPPPRSSSWRPGRPLSDCWCGTRHLRRPQISARDVAADGTSDPASDSVKEMGLVNVPACCHPAYCDNHRMQRACMCSLAKLLKRYSAKTMRNCGESFLPSIQGGWDSLFAKIATFSRKMSRCRTTT
jgi:ribosomal protein L31